VPRRVQGRERLAHSAVHCRPPVPKLSHNTSVHETREKPMTYDLKRSTTRDPGVMSFHMAYQTLSTLLPSQCGKSWICHLVAENLRNIPGADGEHCRYVGHW
jgi:hypothetical protein